MGGLGEADGRVAGDVVVGWINSKTGRGGLDDYFLSGTEACRLEYFCFRVLIIIEFTLTAVTVLRAVLTRPSRVERRASSC